MPLPERKLIAGIKRMAGATSAGVHGDANATGVLQGIGDDCARLQIPSRHEILVTTDFSLEGIHFRRDWHPSESVGHRCLARGLSDIAAMGGKPMAAFLSLALPKGLSQTWVEGFMRGFMKLARRHKVTLAGGDTAQSPHGVLADVTVVGNVPHGTSVMRAGARPGDILYATGELGASAATLRILMRNKGKKILAVQHKEHFYPEPRIKGGEYLRKKKIAHAMIDISDGLSVDVTHICKDSGVGAMILADRLPMDRAMKILIHEKPALQAALHGGEDYELLFTAAESKRIPKSIAGVNITPIGIITKSKKISLTDSMLRTIEPLEANGWEHFKK